VSIKALQDRFKKFAIDTAVLISELPKNLITIPYCSQLVRCSSSSGANYRAVSRAKSKADFINKLKIVEEELDESIYFLELLEHFNTPLKGRFQILIKEANELLAITVSSIKTSRE
jgi:four helix bundle protein